MEELFSDFYMSQRQVKPSEEIMELFLSIAIEEDEDETKEIKN